jgi:hypothetical protein
MWTPPGIIPRIRAYRPEFEQGNYDPITVRAVFAQVEDVEAQIGRFDAMQSRLSASASGLRDAFTSGDPEARGTRPCPPRRKRWRL